VSLFDYHEENLVKAAEQLSNANTSVHTYPVDVSSKKAVTEAIAKAEALQPIDVLINNAGIAFETPFLHIEEGEWKNILDINLTGMFFVAQAVCRFMAVRKKGW
jgi:3-oxoacyl-[acyl-carrier protein] reductase